MKFHEIRFPEDISFGAEGGPERRSEIVQLANGREHINSPWDNSIRKYNVSTGVKSIDQLSQIIDFFEFCNGSEIGFRWKDWTDFKSSIPIETPSSLDQLIGVGDGIKSKFQLTKQYGFGEYAYLRKITKPKERSILIAVDENLVQEMDDFTVDYQTGLVVFQNPPSEGASITAGFEFDVPVRFDVDTISISLTHFDAGEIQNIDVKELI